MDSGAVTPDIAHGRAPSGLEQGRKQIRPAIDSGATVMDGLFPDERR